MSTENSERSALRDNIEKKGSNAYYYAHDSKINGPEWDGKEEPRLLSTISTESSESSRSCTSIREYSWGDGKKIVTVYVDFEEALEIDENKIEVETTVDTLSFRITDFKGKDYKLYIDKLNAEVESASFKVKEGLRNITCG